MEMNVMTYLYALVLEGGVSKMLSQKAMARDAKYPHLVLRDPRASIVQSSLLFVNCSLLQCVFVINARPPFHPGLVDIHRLDEHLCCRMIF